MTKLSALRRSLGLVAALAAFAGLATVASAGTLGNIQGTVRDSASGAPLAGVHLDIVSGSQSASATTDAHGHYVVFSLQPDNYTVTAEKDGYATRSVAGYSVFADQTQVYDLQLDPASGGGSGN
jgi:Carboxypeptidase regulatory-like domain